MRITLSRIFIGLAILILLGVGIFYAFGWDIATKILPILDKEERVPVSDPSSFQLPPGFSVSVYSADTPGARVLVRDPKGTLLVSESSEGKVVALPDSDTDGKADSTVTVLQGLNGPHGMAFICPEATPQKDCTLYVAEADALKSYSYDADAGTATYKETLAQFPADKGHVTRTLLPSADGKSILVSIGSDCNVCNEENPLRATVQVFDLAAKSITTFAKGLRNTVFMARNPITGAVWGTDMGRDLLGDNIPPDEVNILEEGKNYGWPVCYGNNLHDTDFDHKMYIRDPCMAPFETPPLIEIPAHSAPLGLAFIPEEGWPADMRNNLLVAYHGSWNRSEPDGYKIVMFPLNAEGTEVAGDSTDFMTGFIDEKGTVIGRPVGLLAEPGGVLYVSDDRAGAVYRVTYNIAQ